MCNLALATSQHRAVLGGVRVQGCTPYRTAPRPLMKAASAGRLVSVGEEHRGRGLAAYAEAAQENWVTLRGDSLVLRSILAPGGRRVKGFSHFFCAGGETS